MPDYFVPLDTTMSSSYVNRLFNSNVAREYILDYLDANKKKFDGMTFEDYYKKYEVSDNMLQSLVKLGESKKIKFDEKDFNKSKAYLKTVIKAQMGQSIFGENAFYKVINDINEVYLRAILLFDEAEKLAFSPKKVE